MEFSRQEHRARSHSLLQGIFLTQGSNLGLLHCRQTLYCLSQQGSPTEIQKLLLKHLMFDDEIGKHILLLYRKTYSYQNKEEVPITSMGCFCNSHVVFRAIFFFLIFIFNWLMFGLQYWFDHSYLLPLPIAFALSKDFSWLWFFAWWVDSHLKNLVY